MQWFHKNISDDNFLLVEFINIVCCIILITIDVSISSLFVIQEIPILAVNRCQISGAYRGFCLRWVCISDTMAKTRGSRKGYYSGSDRYWGNERLCAISRYPRASAFHKWVEFQKPYEAPFISVIATLGPTYRISFIVCIALLGAAIVSIILSAFFMDHHKKQRLRQSAEWQSYELESDNLERRDTISKVPSRDQKDINDLKSIR